MGWIVLAWLAGCGLPKCEELCAERAGCVQREIDEFGSTWPDWTGFPDRKGYEDGCFAAFDASRQQGAPRGDLQHTCRTALDRDPCGAPND